MKLLYDHSTHSLITPTGFTFATLDPNVTTKEGQWVADELELAAGIEDADPEVVNNLEKELEDAENALCKANEETEDAHDTIVTIINEIDTLFLDMDDRYTVEEALHAINEILEPHR